MKEFSDKLLNILTTKYDGLNLTRITDPKEFYDKQIVDSVAAYEQSRSFKKSLQKFNRHIDIGFGGGFPLLPLAKSLPDVKFIGLEARAKKVKAVNDIAALLGLDNVNCYHCRYETLSYNLPVSVSIKAVGPITKVLDGFKSFQEIEIFFYKGPQVYQLEEVIKTYYGWEMICSDLIEVPGTQARYLIGYRKKSVPRRTKNNKELVNLTALV